MFRVSGLAAEGNIGGGSHNPEPVNNKRLA